MDEYQIIADARKKHNLDIKLYPNCGIVELVRYARHIGFNEGFKAALVKAESAPASTNISTMPEEAASIDK